MINISGLVIENLTRDSKRSNGFV